MEINNNRINQFNKNPLTWNKEDNENSLAIDAFITEMVERSQELKNSIGIHLKSKLKLINPNQMQSSEQLYYLGVRALLGFTGKKDESTAARYFKAAALDHLAAQYYLGLMYDIGRGVKANPQKSSVYFQKASNQNYKPSFVQQGILSASGLGVGKSIEKAMMLYMAAAEQKDPLAECLLGQIYLLGIEGVEQNYEKALFYLQKAAEQNFASAQVSLGWMYELGKGLIENKKKVFFYYQAAADQNYCPAQENLANDYYDKWGKKKLAQIYYYLAAHQGQLSAQFNLGHCFLEGIGGEKDEELGLFYFHLAANQGLQQAQYSLAERYRKGNGIEQDLNRAIHYHTLAANQGDSESQMTLGFMYLSENGVTQNFKLAFDYSKLAADQGHSRAACYLGIMYQAGMGMEPNHDVALMYYRQSAQKKDAAGLFKMGLMYVDGLGGLDRSLREALKCFKLALEQKNLDVQENYSKELWVFMWNQHFKNVNIES